MQPTDIFFVITIAENKPSQPKKAAVSRIPNHSYIQADLTNVAIPFTIGSVPYLFQNREIAEATMKGPWVRALHTVNVLQMEVVPLRVVESSPYYQHSSSLEDDKYARIRDARKIAYQMLHYDEVAGQVKKLAGKVLTIIDAAYVNENQNKAVKDLLKSSFRSQLSDLWSSACEDPDKEGCAGETSGKDILD